MLEKALKTLGKSLLIVTGVGYGIFKALDEMSAEPQEDPSATPQDFTLPMTQNDKPETLNSSSPLRYDPKPGQSAGMLPNDHAALRLKAIEDRLILIEDRLDVLVAPLDRLPSRANSRGGDNLITRAEMYEAMSQLSSRLEEDIQRRFEVQNRSVQSLRTMVARTDELLEQVIENIESISVTA